MSPEEILVQCEIMLMEIGHDLDRWKRELDQAKYASRLQATEDHILGDMVTFCGPNTKAYEPKVTFRRINYSKMKVSKQEVEGNWAPIDPRGALLEMTPAEIMRLYGTELGNAMGITLNMYRSVQGLVDPDRTRELHENYASFLGESEQIQQERINRFMKELPDVGPEDHGTRGERTHRLPKLRRQRGGDEPRG